MQIQVKAGGHGLLGTMGVENGDLTGAFVLRGPPILDTHGIPNFDFPAL